MSYETVEVCFFYSRNCKIYKYLHDYRRFDFGPSMEIEKLYSRVEPKVLSLCDFLAQQREFPAAARKYSPHFISDKITRIMDLDYKIARETKKGTELWTNLLSKTIEQLPANTISKHFLRWVSVLEAMYDLRWKLLRHHMPPETLEKEGERTFKRMTEITKLPMVKEKTSISPTHQLQITAAINLYHLGLVDKKRSYLKDRYKGLLKSLAASQKKRYREKINSMMNGRPLTKYD